MANVPPTGSPNDDELLAIKLASSVDESLLRADESGFPHTADHGNLLPATPTPSANPIDGFSAPSQPDHKISKPPVPNASAESKVTVVDHMQLGKDGLNTDAKVADDGRVHIDINQSSRKLAKLFSLAQSISHPAPQPTPTTAPLDLPPPRLNIVVQVVGSRGDVQPFVALGKMLKEQHRHRIRLATHATFKGFVEENGLEFFNIGGDPAQLMAFMVKNPNLMPGFESLRHGDVGKRQHEIWEILIGCWRSCIEPGDGMDRDGSSEELEDHHRPFIADVIIANPPSFAHIHCAEKLGIPVHLMFTMPWTPTQAFPHPLANIQSSNADPHLSNMLSYTLVEALTWQGLGPVINRFRQQYLRLEHISLIWAPNLLNRLHVPYTYCWSPSLIPKPHDWGSNIDIAGFYFLSLASSFKPDTDLQLFLDAGPPPVYIGFGSIVVDDPNAMTSMIFKAVEKAGVRALVSKGWGGVGKGDMFVPDSIYMLGNIPHDWLFQRVSCVVHHGGAGTTAAGSALGKPTVVVPFFGDQPFWGAMIARAGAGPTPVPYKHLNAEILAASIRTALEPSMKEKAASLAASIAQERGTEEGARSFHRQLGVDNIRCSVSPDRNAVWRVKRTQIRLSSLAATVLIHGGLLKPDGVKLYRPKEYDTRSEPVDPISAMTSGVSGAIGDIMMTSVSLPKSSVNGIRDLGRTIHKRHMSTNGSDVGANNLPRVESDSLSQATTLVPNEPDKPSTMIDTRSSIDSDRYAANIASRHQSHDSQERASIERTHSIALSIGHQTDGPAGIATDERFAKDDEHKLDFVPTAVSNSSSLGKPASTIKSTSSTQSTIPTNKITTAHATLGSGKLEQNPAELTGRFLYGMWVSPMEFTLSLARGFHNAPKLYGDSTVRKPDKVIDLHSGVKQAGKELVYGFYDGFTGLVTQPIDGAKSEGIKGFVKGVGKGLGGVLLKPSAGILGAPGYTWKGLYKEARKSRGKKIENFIIAARTADGVEEFEHSSKEERETIVRRWNGLFEADKGNIDTKLDHLG